MSGGCPLYNRCSALKADRINSELICELPDRIDFHCGFFFRQTIKSGDIMNKKIILSGIFAISVIGMADAETTNLISILGPVFAIDSTYDTNTMTFSANYGDFGSITGRAQCSSLSGCDIYECAVTIGNVTTHPTLPDNSGDYCYCTLDSYTPVGGNVQVLSALWVVAVNYYDGQCASKCAYTCAGFMGLTENSGRPFMARDAIINAVETPIIIAPPTISCDAGYYLPAGTTECAICPANSYCAGGEYEKSETTDSGIALCQSGLIAPAGMWQAEQCGHALHIGDAVLYLRQTKQTEHALHIQSGDNIFYGNATTADVPMNINTNRHFKILFNDIVYSIYDDTIKIDN